MTVRWRKVESLMVRRQAENRVYRSLHSVRYVGLVVYWDSEIYSLLSFLKDGKVN